mmetsp:Transcript_6501/g.11619  ORF Transcript_6501/g.11619 Transcript_6501/m.11619 type:complete len:230 (-) Transcript_6501:3155-3844(-)
MLKSVLSIVGVGIGICLGSFAWYFRPLKLETLLNENKRETDLDRKKGTKSCIYAGSFNPPHSGHLYVIHELCKYFDVVHIGIAQNPRKKQNSSEPSIESRKKLIQQCISSENQAQIRIHRVEGYVWKFARNPDINAMFLARGFRSFSVDFVSESSLYLLNIFGPILVAFQSPMRTVFVKAPECLHDISSSLVRKRISNKFDISQLVPQNCANLITSMYSKSDSIPTQGN